MGRVKSIPPPILSKNRPARIGLRASNLNLRLLSCRLSVLKFETNIHLYLKQHVEIQNTFFSFATFFWRPLWDNCRPRVYEWRIRICTFQVNKGIRLCSLQVNKEIRLCSLQVNKGIRLCSLQVNKGIRYAYKRIRLYIL